MAKLRRCTCSYGCPRPASVKVSVTFNNGISTSFDKVCVVKAIEILQDNMPQLLASKVGS
ncbi:hypothetical protein [Methylobacter sp.]|uniref:hypothetical protein n=1 Tax=Methylobacter sp. TaxID=2051955 RepID=UPI001219D96B|nr:hypothetical protein [Methylobacter sp.]TAK59504.1 MAG: hypothetical protein EPO18_20290 [Methylobacter sp.]